MKASTQTERIRRLDSLYLNADAATNAWLKCTDEKIRSELYKKAMHLWEYYYNMKNEPYEHLPMI